MKAPFVKFHVPGHGTWQHALSVTQFRRHRAAVIDYVNRKRDVVLIYDGRSMEAKAVVVWTPVGKRVGRIVRK